MVISFAKFFKKSLEMIISEIEVKSINYWSGPGGLIADNGSINRIPYLVRVKRYLKILEQIGTTWVLNLSLASSRMVDDYSQNKIKKCKLN
jgi:hypothetical protein